MSDRGGQRARAHRTGARGRRPIVWRVLRPGGPCHGDCDGRKGYLRNPGGPCTASSTWLHETGHDALRSRNAVRMPFARYHSRAATQPPSPPRRESLGKPPQQHSRVATEPGAPKLHLRVFRGHPRRSQLRIPSILQSVDCRSTDRRGKIRTPEGSGRRMCGEIYLPHTLPLEHSLARARGIFRRQPLN
jgi:hypothetical protein